MQETQYKDKIIQEFFAEQTFVDIEKAMDSRFKVLQERGHTLVRRVEIGRNDKCPCNSGLKFKKCCIDKINLYREAE